MMKENFDFKRRGYPQVSPPTAVILEQVARLDQSNWADSGFWLDPCR